MGALTSLATARYGWDRHAWDVPLQWLPDSLKMRMAFQITFTVASCFTKLSLLWFCRRILGAGIKGPFRVFNYCLIGAMALVFILALIFILLTIFTCMYVVIFQTCQPARMGDKEELITAKTKTDRSKPHST